MKPIVFYYSRSGKTEKLARLIATQTRAEIIRIDPEIAYDGFAGSVGRVIKERISRKPMQAMTPAPDLKEFDPVFIGFPVWGNDIPLFMKDFISRCDLKGKTVIPFATYAVSGISHSLQSLKKLVPDSVVVLPFEDGLLNGSKYKKWRLELRRYMRNMEDQEGSDPKH